MSKKLTYVLFAILTVVLAVFIGMYIGQNKDLEKPNHNYKPPEIIDDSGVVHNPDLGTTEDAENLVGEKYYLKPNSASFDNTNYFINNNNIASSDAEKNQYVSFLNSTYTGNIGESSFITVERLAGGYSEEINKQHSNLVYIKFSTYLAKYEGSEIISKEPAVVLFGYEQTSDGQYLLRYSFCTYGDRGEVNSLLGMFVKKDKVEGQLVKLRVPYLLTSSYEDTVRLFNIEGLTKDNFNYKLLNNNEDQLYIDSDVLTTISALTKYIVKQNMSGPNNNIYLKNFDLTKYIKIKDKTCDFVLSNVVYKKDLFSAGKANYVFDYFSYSLELLPGTGFNSVLGWFNNDQAIYNIPLVNVSC